MTLQLAITWTNAHYWSFEKIDFSEIWIKIHNLKCCPQTGGSLYWDLNVLKCRYVAYTQSNDCASQTSKSYHGTIDHTYTLTLFSFTVTMMTSSNGNTFRVTGPLWGESAGHWWIPLTKASGVELWCFLWSAPEQTVEQRIGTAPVIWDAIALHDDVTVMAFSISFPSHIPQIHIFRYGYIDIVTCT